MTESRSISGLGVLAEAGGRFGAGTAAAWLLVELTSLRVVVDGYEPLLYFSFLALLCGMFFGLLFALASFAAQKSGPTSGAGESVPAALLLMLLTWLPLQQLFDGRWISRQFYTPVLRIVLPVLVCFACWFILRRVLIAARSSWKGRLAAGLFCAVSACSAFILERLAVIERIYPAIHTILILSGLLFAGGASVLLLVRGGRILGRALAVGSLGVVALFLTNTVDARAPLFRELVLRQGRLSSQILSPMLGSLLGRSADAAEIDPVLLARLSLRRTLDPDAVDAAFPARRQTDIIMITVDTLRHDALSATGGTASTPHMDALARGGMHFRSAWTQFPATEKGIGSMLRGRYPQAVADSATEDGSGFLAADLRQAGYATVALTSFPGLLFTDIRPLFHYGFQRFDNDSGDYATRTERVVDRAIDLLESPPEDPLFLWIHLFDPHGSPHTSGSEAAQRSPRERYDLEVEHVDGHLGRLINTLRSRNRDYLILLNADHGEEFFDHGGMRHNSSLFEEQIRVPLIVNGSQVKPGVCDYPVELVDLAATVREFAGLPEDKTGHGHSLLPIVADLPPENWPPDCAMSFFRFPNFVHGNLDCVRSGRWKLIYDRERSLFELYDLVEDPGELKNLALSHRRELQEMQTVLATAAAFAGNGTESETTAERADRLLGMLPDDPGAELKKECLKVLRQPVERDGSVMAVLLDHKDREIRHGALIQTAIFGAEEAVFKLRGRVEENSERGIEARVVLALRGEEISLEALPLVSSAFYGEERSLHHLARYVAGDASLAAAIYHTFNNTQGRPDLATLFISTLVRENDVGFLPVLYARLNIGLWPQQVAVAVRMLTAMESGYAAPVIRRILSSPDKGLRDRVASEIAALPDFEAWSVAAREIETSIGLATLRFTGRPAERPGYVSDLQSAFLQMADAGYLDWGLALDFAVGAFSFQPDTNVGATLRRTLREGIRNDDSNSTALVDRLSAVSDARRGRIRGRLEILPDQGLLEEENGVVPLLVRLVLDGAGSSATGGITKNTEMIGASVHGPDGRIVGIAPFIPLPITGVLPGESGLMIAPLYLNEEARGTLQIRCRLTRAGQDIIKPAIMEFTRK